MDPITKKAWGTIWAQADDEDTGEEGNAEEKEGASPDKEESEEDEELFEE